MTAIRDLDEAHKLIRRAETVWPTAHTNLECGLTVRPGQADRIIGWGPPGLDGKRSRITERVPIGGAVDPFAGGTQAGYPTGPSDNPHACPCRGQCACPCPRCACDTRLTPVEAAALTNDPARHALRTIDAHIGLCVVVCCTILDIECGDSRLAQIARTSATQRLTALGALLGLAGQLELTPYAAPDARHAYHHAVTIHSTVSRWAFTPTRERPEHHVTSDQWCRHCLATGEWCEPVWRAGLCAWCYSFVTANRRGLPVLELLVAHHDGRRVTQQMIDHHQPRGRKKAA